MPFTKSSLTLSIIVIYLFISSCSTRIYENFEDPILVENVFEVNDSIIKRDPVSLLIQPSPINKFLGYPLGLAINNLASQNPDEKFDVMYSCLRCGTKVSNSELNRLPEIKCICGFRVFTKVRPPIVKTVKAI